MSKSFDFSVNGKPVSVSLDNEETPLLDVLRNELGLMGTRFGCGLEQCGCCMVLIDGAPEKWITSALTTFRPRTSVGSPTGISITLQGKRYFVLEEPAKKTSSAALMRSVVPGGPANNSGRSRRLRYCPSIMRNGIPPK